MFGSVAEEVSQKSMAREWSKAEGGGRGERSITSSAVFLFIPGDFLHYKFEA